MNKIEVGTKIIITTPWAGETKYKKGDIFTVASANPQEVYVVINGESEYIASDEFEVYTEPEFKVGDRVRVLTDSETPCLKKGDVGTVTDTDNSSYTSIEVQQDKPYTLGAGEWNTTPGNLELLSTVEPAQHEYNEGDRVQITIPKGDTDAYGGMYFVTGTGTVAEVDGGGVIQVDADTKHPERDSRDGWWVDKKYVTPLEGEPEQEPLAEWEKELLNVFPRKIELDDIQLGDLIKAEYTANGIKYSREATATKKHGDYWIHEGSYIANPDWNATYTLLERPESPKPNMFAEAKVGSLATYGGNGVKYLKNAENQWTAITDRGDLLSFGNTDADMLDNGNAAVTYNA